MRTVDGLLVQHWPTGHWADLSGNIDVVPGFAVRVHLSVRTGHHQEDFDALLLYLTKNRDRLKKALADAENDEITRSIDQIMGKHARNADTVGKGRKHAHRIPD